MEQLQLDTFKSEIHRTLISKLDLEKLSRVNSSQARQAVASLVSEIISGQRVPLNLGEQEKIKREFAPGHSHRVNLARLRGHVFDRAISTAIEAYMPDRLRIVRN